MGVRNWETHAVPKRLNLYINDHPKSISVGSKNYKKWAQVDQKSIKNWYRNRTRIWNAKEFETDATVLSVFNILAPLGWFRCHFWPHWIFKGVPKSTIFEKNKKKKKRKRRSKNRLKKNMICVSVFHWISDGRWSHFWCFLIPLPFACASF